MDANYFENFSPFSTGWMKMTEHGSNGGIYHFYGTGTGGEPGSRRAG
jgi:hypothetical protein